MSEIALKVENISKKYKLNSKKNPYFRDFISQLFNGQNSSKNDFWALKDISFEVKRGEVLGIIGRNGAGKSTLLKILSQIMQPTSGRFEINGKVNSLLEVGTGFHPDLSGRENVFLNGSILGMKRTEIKAKFDEIVAFSGVEKFIDTQVKHYSSGMYVRLAFAVVAHLESEILILDEVLAVGDYEFQKKSLDKIKSLIHCSKTTVLLVSHNLPILSSLASKSILLNNGQIVNKGETDLVIEKYLYNTDNSSKPFQIWNQLENSPSDNYVNVKKIGLINENKDFVNLSYVDKKVGIMVVYEIIKSGAYPTPVFHLYSSTGEKIFGNNPPRFNNFSLGEHTAIMWFSANFFNSGTYTIDFELVTWGNDLNIHLKLEKILTFEILDKLDSMTLSADFRRFRGVIRPLLEWTIE